MPPKKVDKIGIFAYGSLIEDPGIEIEPLIVDRVQNVETPFRIEFARKSIKRGDAPTVVPVQSGGSSAKATILILKEGTTIKQAEDLLWRRETRNEYTDDHYKGPSEPGSDHVVVETIRNVQGVDTVLYTTIRTNIENPTAEELATHAINSAMGYAGASGKDGISYLLSLKRQGISTPLMPEYEQEILRRIDVSSLDEALDRVGKIREALEETKEFISLLIEEEENKSIIKERKLDPEGNLEDDFLDYADTLLETWEVDEQIRIFEEFRRFICFFFEMQKMLTDVKWRDRRVRKFLKEIRGNPMLTDWKTWFEFLREDEERKSVFLHMDLITDIGPNDANDFFGEFEQYLRGRNLLNTQSTNAIKLVDTGIDRNLAAISQSMNSAPAHGDSSDKSKLDKMADYLIQYLIREQDRDERTQAGLARFSGIPQYEWSRQLGKPRLIRLINERIESSIRDAALLNEAREDIENRLVKKGRKEESLDEILDDKPWKQPGRTDEKFAEAEKRVDLEKMNREELEQEYRDTYRDRSDNLDDVSDEQLIELILARS
jgi:hypothetical protein